MCTSLMVLSFGGEIFLHLSKLIHLNGFWSYGWSAACASASRSVFAGAVLVRLSGAIDAIVSELTRL